VLLKRRKSDTLDPSTPPGRWRLYGDDDAEIVVGGHSNVACLIAARDGGLGLQRIRSAVAYPADFGALEEDYWDFLADAGAGRTVALVWDGNQHNGAFLVQPDPPFRVHRSTAGSGPQNDEPGTWVPRAMVSSYWETSFALLGSMVDRLSGRSRVLVVGTPPPKSDGDLRATLDGKLDWDRWITDIASTRGQASSELPISPAPLRLALWSVIQDRLREEARRSGATFVPVPDRACDAAGFLAAACSADDLTHANAQYGGLMWAQIEAVLQANAER
jgi:hypothetical protein